MKAKAARRRYAARYDENGVPRDVNDWTIQDWKDLHEAMQTVIRKVGERHHPESATLTGSGQEEAEL